MATTRKTPSKTNPADAQKAEARTIGEIMAEVEEAAEEKDPIKVSWRGVMYTIPEFLDWTIDTMEAYERGNVVSAVRGLLGEEQWAQFRLKNATMGDVMDFSEALNKASRGNAGE